MENAGKEFEYADLAYLTVPLPEDIMKLKWYGDFERAERVIDLRLKKEIPVALRKRLELEKLILKRLPKSYIFTEEEALKALQERVKDVTKEEFDELIDEGAIEWIYVNGQRKIMDDFIDNLLKTRPHISARIRDAYAYLVERRAEDIEQTNAMIRRQIEQGGMNVRFHIRETFRVREGKERPDHTIRVHMPLPISYAQVENVQILSTSEKPLLIAPKDYPQRTACFEKKMKPGEAITMEFTYEIHAPYVDPKPEEVFVAQPTFYLEEQLPHIQFTPYIRVLVKEIIGEETNPLVKARKIYDYITTHLMYSFVRSYFAITDIPGFASTSWKGDCGVQALLFITMCRAAGVPARWQAGLSVSPDGAGCHDWAQFYVAPYGWLYADCSFGGARYRAGNLEGWNFYFGNLEPFRMPANCEFQHDLVPAKNYLRHDPYDNQTGEAEYDDRAMTKDEYEITIEVLKMEELK
ncbi:MAG: transglutaminase-like domain-containing protein [bacterium]|nr:transglutaminase-like domain-containing protein [bacterium]